MLSRLLPDLECRLSTEVRDPASIDIALIWKPPPHFELYTHLKAILSLGAGIDQLDLGSLPAGVPIARLKDPDLTNMMRIYCQLAVLRYHRGFDRYEQLSRAGGAWLFEQPRPTRSSKVGVLGLGELGGAVARDLVALGFTVGGWSRGPKEIQGVECFSGRDRLFDMAVRCDILVNLLPLTSETEGILNRRLFEAMPKGSRIINVGRGRHLVEDDLVLALESGQIGGATLDVFRQEPLPADHPFWRNPHVLITPHVATSANPETAAPQVIENIHRALRGQRLINQVDLDRGY